MNFKNRFKKNGFSLMEILIAVLIVTILALVTMPVLNSQISKANEYSYYLAYQSVEKIAGQIVALGDPEENTAHIIPNNTLIADKKDNLKFKSIFANNPFNKLVSTISDKFAYTQTYILSKFVPKSVAASTTTTEQRNRNWGSWYNDDYDEIWTAYQVCANGRTGVFPRQSTTETTTTTDPETGEITEGTSTTTQFLNKSDFGYCFGYTRSGFVSVGNDGTESEVDTNDDSGEAKHSVLMDTLFAGNLDEVCGITEANYDTFAQSVANSIANQNRTGMKPDAEAFCNNVVKTKCKHGRTVSVNSTNYTMDVYYEVDESLLDLDEEELAEGEHEYPTSVCVSDSCNPKRYPGSCVVNSTYTITVYTADEDQYVSSKPEFDEDWCDHNGYYNMKNRSAEESPTGKSNVIDCQCKDGYVPTVNNEKACVFPCTSKIELPYVKTRTSSSGNVSFIGRECCATDFNPIQNTCCPEKSVYNPTSGRCECASGYKMNTAGSVCELVDCPAGSHKTDDDVCVVNPPIILGKRLCEEITKHWNVDESATNCNVFSRVGSSGNFNAYLPVYNAALNKSGNKVYLSVNSKIGAFNDIAPNIVLANGLKLWILGDKAASIPGLTYFGDNITSSQNMCVKKKLSKNDAITCYNEGGYFCKSENTCLVLDEASKTSGAIGDARACCSASDVTDLQEESEAMGAGHEEDWKRDQRVYGISGFTVFVDINGDKGDGTLWDDVFPFFIGSDGVVYPGYPLDAPKGSVSGTGSTMSTLLYRAGNGDKELPVDVYYYKSSDLARQRKVAFSGVSYARAMCSARKISKYSPYCLNLGEKFHGGNGFSSSDCPTAGGCTSPVKLNGISYIQIDGKESRNPCDHYNCFVSVRRKLRSF